MALQGVVWCVAELTCCHQDGDKENEVESSNDGGSERQLTQTISRTEGKKASVVLVSTNWEVTREERTT